ncbi:hypothetical protein AAIB41_03490 [Brucella sp. BE17]|uniref:hypothetical protein n=1 Tax=Brucella sp. BE17 TaxID=3142977 RepID=UPI0031BB353A
MPPVCIFLPRFIISTGHRALKGGAILNGLVFWRNTLFNSPVNRRKDMRIKAIAAVSGCMIIATNAHAALAPNYQRAKEMTAIIEAVAEKIPTHPISKIIYQKPDQYQVIAGPCSIRAMIITKPGKPMMVGPRQFEVKLSSQKCGG